jgi:hypothetical protein
MTCGINHALSGIDDDVLFEQSGSPDYDDDTNNNGDDGRDSG